MHDLVASYLCGATILDLAARHDICRTTVSKYLKQTRWPSSWQRDWLTKSRLRYDEPPAFNVPVRGHEKVRTFGHEKSAPVATRSPQLWPSDVLTPR
jgi:hypothetical protein